MIPPFDVFHIESTGALLWRGDAGTLEEARALVRKLAKDGRECYIILSQRTGNKIAVNSDGSDTS